MSGIDSINNITMENYDYANYYIEGDSKGSLCNNSNMEGIGPIFLPSLYSLVFILGFIGNGLVVAVFTKHRRQINVTDVCLLNLAISDLFFVLSLPFYSHTALASGQWIFGAFMCHLVTGLYVMGFYGGIFSVTFMTLDRYVVIMHPHTLARHRRFRWGITMTALVWVLSFSVSLPTIAVTQLKNESLKWHCDYVPESSAWRHTQILLNNIFGLLIPLLVMVICYSRVLPSLMAMRGAKKHRAVKLVITIIGVFFLFWTPYNIGQFLLFYRDISDIFPDCERENLDLFNQIAEAIAFTHCCLNPIIYAFVGQKFARRAHCLLHAWVPWVCRCVPEDRGWSSRKGSVALSSSEGTSTFTM